jgi:hypothetical protein
MQAVFAMRCDAELYLTRIQRFGYLDPQKHCYVKMLPSWISCAKFAEGQKRSNETNRQVVIESGHGCRNLARKSAQMCPVRAIQCE